MLWPNGSTDRPTISDDFGYRGIHPVWGTPAWHYGTDFVGFDTVRAIDDGEVIVAGTPAGWSGGGTQVWVQHAWGVSRSLHLDSRTVSVGDHVTAGQSLGVMGMTGTATGVHLHLEVVVDGDQIDSIPFITDRLQAAPPAPAPVPEEDDTMQFLIINGIGTGQHYVALDNGLFRHFIQSDPYDKIMRIGRARDDWQPIEADELPATLRTWGCDLRIWDWRPAAGGFCVLDPLDGSVKPGNVWTAANAARSQIAQLPTLITKQTAAYEAELAKTIPYGTAA
ncbi:M23 family metallopeptidase [Streptomyces sp. MS2A]|nr:M23 family metallopeptidase [Streptomyces sp. MS2A]